MNALENSVRYAGFASHQVGRSKDLEDRAMPVEKRFVNNWDCTLLKDTKLTKRVAVQFRTEFFNVFNRVQFAQSGLAVGNPSFGVISSQTNTPD
jgi:hypothetical protein